VAPAADQIVRRELRPQGVAARAVVSLASELGEDAERIVVTCAPDPVLLADHPVVRSIAADRRALCPMNSGSSVRHWMTKVRLVRSTSWSRHRLCVAPRLRPRLDRCAGSRSDAESITASRERLLLQLRACAAGRHNDLSDGQTRTPSTQRLVSKSKRRSHIGTSLLARTPAQAHVGP
jgi:hypothetical protein